MSYQKRKKINYMVKDPKTGLEWNKTKCMARTNNRKQCSRSRLPKLKFCKTHYRKFTSGNLIHGTVDEPVISIDTSCESKVIDLGLLENTIYDGQEYIIRAKVKKIHNESLIVEEGDDDKLRQVFRRIKTSDQVDNIVLVGFYQNKKFTKLTDIIEENTGIDIKVISRSIADYFDM